jgi:hypothetical protein
MTIKERLLQVQAAVVLDKARGGVALAEAVGFAAEAAIRDGIYSTAGRAYMAIFANSVDQLTRLTTDELDGDNTYLPRVRAYVAANGVCAPGTDAATIKGLMGVGDIDAPKPDNEPLDDTPDQTVIDLRAVKIPDLPAAAAPQEG